MRLDGYAHGLEFVIGGKESLRAVRAVAAAPHPRSGLLLDVFKLNHPALVREVTHAADHGPVGVLLDPEFVASQPRAALARRGAALIEYGDMPAKNHAKGIVGTRGLISSVPYTRFARTRLDFGAMLDEAGTAALRDLIRAGLNHDSEAIRAAALAARGHGILLNDPLNGIFTLTEYLDDAFATSDSILAASKVTLDETSIEAMTKRAAAGAKVNLITREIDDESRWELQHAGAGVHEMATLHGNAMVFGRNGGKEAYVGSAYLHPRSLGRNSRPTRELAVVTNDPQAVQHLKRTLRGIQ